jgi:hypothetical protein
VLRPCRSPTCRKSNCRKKCRKSPFHLNPHDSTLAGVRYSRRG